jgi:hypothetical protein
MWTFGGSADGSSSVPTRTKESASCDGLGLAGQLLHPIRFYQRVKYEGAADLSLTIPAVAAVHEHRLGGEPIAQRAASATSFERRAH